MGKGKILKRVLSVLLALVLIAIGAAFGRSFFVEKQAEQDFDELAQEVNRVDEPLEKVLSGTEVETEEAAEAVEDEIEIPEKNLDWEELSETNDDIYAWIYIPGTAVDYPILQHPTDDSYYLNYNMKGTKGYPGCIYTEHQTSMEFTDFDTVIYGHNMKNDTMFSTLHDYEDPEFFSNCPYIYIYTDNKVLVYYIFAAYVGDDAHILNTNDFSTEDGRESYLHDIKAYGREAGLINEETAGEAASDSRILTLSTCVSGKPDNRFLVHALLVEEEEL